MVIIIMKNQSISGTPWHIDSLRMSESDSKRHRAHCEFYNRKTKKCTMPKSPYFNNHCGGSSRCSFYKEIENNFEDENNAGTHREKINKEKNFCTDDLDDRSISDYDRLKFSVGKRILHKSFGSGVIRDIKGDRITIDFKTPDGYHKDSKSLSLSFCCKHKLID